jgi:hypothetical protein
MQRLRFGRLAAAAEIDCFGAIGWKRRRVVGLVPHVAAQSRGL